MEPLKPYILFEWSTVNIDPKLKLTSSTKEVQCLDSTGPYKTIFGNLTLIPGNISYWEIKIQKGTYFKIGVVKSGTKITKGAFSDTQDGWAFMSVGQLRHNNYCKGEEYASAYGSGDIIGVLFDQNKGKLGFFLNNKYLGNAFTDKEFTEHSFYPAVSVLVKGEKFQLYSADRED